MPTEFSLRINFSGWYMQQAAVQPDLTPYVLLTDEANLNSRGCVNSHNAHFWEYHNPHVIRPHAHLHRFNVNVCADMVHDYVIKPCILPHHFVRTNLIFFQQVLTELLAAVPQCIRR